MEIIEPGYARVSDILNIFQAYAHVDKEKLRKSQEIGTDVHKAIESYYNDEFCPLDRTKEGYFESFLKWEGKALLEPVIQEKRYYDHNLKITGRIDMLATISDAKVLLDFKTGSWAHPEIWRLQGAFYTHLIRLNEFDHQDIHSILFVQLMKDGSIPKLFEFTPSIHDWNVCVSALECYRYFKSVDFKSTTGA